MTATEMMGRYIKLSVVSEEIRANIQAAQGNPDVIRKLIADQMTVEAERIRLMEMLNPPRAHGRAPQPGNDP